jgi:glutamate racemase
MNTPIGIIDSGFGGLSIYQTLITHLPHESTVYIGDHAYLPYSEKSQDVIQARIRSLIEFLISKHVKLIVIACNSATVAGIDVYRSWFPDIPIVGVVPVIKFAAEVTQKKNFAVLSTVFTAQSVYQKNLIQTYALSCQVHNLGSHTLVHFVEEGQLRGKKIEKELQKILTKQVLDEIDVLALGCTHYPFLIEAIRAIVGARHIQIVDSAGAVVRHIERILTYNKLLASGEPTHIFFSTDGDSKRSRIASQLLGQDTRVTYANR